MGKLMRVTFGSAFLVAVDIRRASPTLGKWFGLEVSADNRKQVWAPPGFARGFCALSDYADVQYKCTGTYNSKAGLGFAGTILPSASSGPSQTPHYRRKIAMRELSPSGLQRRSPSISATPRLPRRRVFPRQAIQDFGPSRRS